MNTERIFSPLFHIDRDTVSAIELSDVYGQWEKLQLNKDQIDALLDAYEKDVMKISPDTLINETPIGGTLRGLSVL